MCLSWQICGKCCIQQQQIITTTKERYIYVFNKALPQNHPQNKTETKQTALRKNCRVRRRTFRSVTGRAAAHAPSAARYGVSMGLLRKKQKLMGEHLKSISFCTLSVRNPAIATDGTNRTARTGSAGAVSEPGGVGAETLPARRCSDRASSSPLEPRC